METAGKVAFEQAQAAELAQQQQRAAAAGAPAEAEAMPPPPPSLTPVEMELLQLKEKHGAGSRLEAVMMELGEEREAAATLRDELAQVKADLVDAKQRLGEPIEEEAAEAT